MNVECKEKHTMRIIKIILALLIFSLTTFVYSQDWNPKINTLLNKIIDTNELLEKHPHQSVTPSEQYLRFVELKKYVSEKELLKLLQHENSVIKGYASWGLIDKKHSNLANLFQVFLQSKDSVTTQSGCLVYEEDLATLFYNQVKYPEFEREMSRKDSEYYQNQLVLLDSILLYSKETHRLLRSALENNKRNKNNYNIIRKLALENNNLNALIELAKYNKESDINSIIEKKENSFEAISFFSHHKFWSFLMNYETKQNSLEFYSAIVAYKNDTAIKSLNRIYKSLAKDDVKSVINLIEAISRNNHIGYQDLTLMIFRNHSILDLRLVKYLLENSPEKSSKSFTNGLLNNKKYYFLEFGDYGTRYSILPLILDNINKYNKKELEKICDKWIKTSNGNELITFLEYVEKYKMLNIQNTIMNRFKGAEIAYTTFHLANTLLSFENKVINKEVMQLLISKQEMWDWGNWSERYREMFKRYDIKIE